MKSQIVGLPEVSIRYQPTHVRGGLPSLSVEIGDLVWHLLALWPFSLVESWHGYRKRDYSVDEYAVDEIRASVHVQYTRYSALRSSSNFHRDEDSVRWLLDKRWVYQDVFDIVGILFFECLVLWLTLSAGASFLATGYYNNPSTSVPFV